MTIISRKQMESRLKQFEHTIQCFDEKSKGTHYWIDQRALILLIHLFIEHFLNKLALICLGYSANRVNDEGFKWKINKLNERGIIDDDLYIQLEILNDARNSIAHELDITVKLSDVGSVYLSMKDTKKKALELISDVIDILNLIVPKTGLPTKKKLENLW